MGVVTISKYIGWPLAAAFGYGVMYLLANRSIYYPMKHPAGYWDERQKLGAADAWLRTSDGVRLHGWWLAHPDARVATLFLHGNAGNVTHRAGHMREIHQAGSSVLVIDYRGYGNSEGRPTERGLYADADAGYRYLVDAGYPPERIVLHGESLGCAVAVDLAARRPRRGLILEAPFTSARDVAGRVLPVIGPLVIWGFDSKRKIPGVRAPVLVIQGTHDEVIPVDLGRALFDAAREPKSYWAVDGAGHNDILEVAGPRYRERLAAFYAGLRPAFAP
jgi:hypothetical protein